jgi:hypothetical protein
VFDAVFIFCGFVNPAADIGFHFLDERLIAVNFLLRVC